jgi:Fe-S cluster assembly protein SufD
MSVLEASNKTGDFVGQFAGDDSRFSKNIQESRAAARALLSDMELPSRKTEAWKYTRTALLAKEQWITGAGTTEQQLNTIPELDCYVLVMVNGNVQEELGDWKALQGELELRAMSDVESLELGAHVTFPSVFSTLNAADFTDGISLRVSKNKVVDKPVHIIQVIEGEGMAAMPRVSVHVEEGADLKVIHTAQLEEGQQVFLNEVGEYQVDANASLTVSRVQGIGKNGFQINHDNVRQAKDSRVTFNTITASSNWVRNDLNVILDGSNTETHLNGAYRLRGSEHCDHHTVVDHKEAHCESNELYKGILFDKSTGVFNGKVFVREDAQKTNAFQQNANIIQSDDATMNSKPELEIYADDVKCSHGSTTGQFDDEAVFYLKSRGLSDGAARQMLESAFLGEALEIMAEGPLLVYLKRHLDLPE